MADYTRELIELLRKNGCHFLRHGKGDHDIWFSPISQKPFTVDGKIVIRHMANKILKDAGIAKHF